VVVNLAGLSRFFISSVGSKGLSFEMAQPTSGSHANVDPGIGSGKAARPPQPHRKRERRAALAIWIGFFVLMVFLAAFSNLPHQLASLVASTPSTPKLDAEAQRTGKIVLRADSGQCKKLKFDNRNGAMTEDPSPCDDELVFDSNGVLVLGSQGVPVPQGTMHRLDAISKSFMAK